MQYGEYIDPICWIYRCTNSSINRWEPRY